VSRDIDDIFKVMGSKAKATCNILQICTLPVEEYRPTDHSQRPSRLLVLSVTLSKTGCCETYQIKPVGNGKCEFI